MDMKEKKERKDKKDAASSNLIPLNKRSDEDGRRIRSMGGKKSSEVRRKKKELRDLTKSFLLNDATEPVKQNMQKLGFDEDDMTNLAAILGAMFMKVLKNGDLNAARTIIEWAGMSPMQQIQENEAMHRLQMIIGDDVVEDNSERVQIYLPEIDNEEELSAKAKFGNKE